MICWHISQTLWYTDIKHYVIGKVGNSSLKREASILEFFAVLCHQPLIWVVQHPPSPPQPPDASSVSAQIEQECLARSQLSEYRVLLSCGCRHFQFGFTTFVSTSLFVRALVIVLSVNRWMLMWNVKLYKWPKMSKTGLYSLYLEVILANILVGIWT